MIFADPQLSEQPNHSNCGVHQIELTSPPIENIIISLIRYPMA